MNINEAKVKEKLNEYYLTKLDNGIFCYSKTETWLPYPDCENNWEEVLILDEKAAWELHDKLERVFPKSIGVRRACSERWIYYHCQWNDEADNWNILGKVVAESYSHACKFFGVDNPCTAEYKIAHYSELPRFGIWSDLQ